MSTPFDLLIMDTTTPNPYEQATLDLQGLGGSEASVIRIAEGLAALGAKVGVMQHNLDQLLMGPSAFYLPMKMLDDVKAHNYVAFRSNRFFDKFPKSKKFTWQQDVPGPNTWSIRDSLIDNNATTICPSEWAKTEYQRVLCDKEKEDNPRIVRIFNPLPDEICIPKSIEVKYDKNKLVWPASPHKGLKEAIELVKRLIDVSGNKDFRLHTFNPGYFKYDGPTERFVVEHGPVPCKELWQEVSESLCVFYPTKFEETFGCIAAEANAVHTPVLTHTIAALSETVSSQRQFVPRNDPKSLIDAAMNWNLGSRPKVWGQDRFRTSEVLKDWVRLLTSSRVFFQ